MCGLPLVVSQQIAANEINRLCASPQLSSVLEVSYGKLIYNIDPACQGVTWASAGYLLKGALLLSGLGRVWRRLVTQYSLDSRLHSWRALTGGCHVTTGTDSAKFELPTQITVTVGQGPKGLLMVHERSHLQNMKNNIPSHLHRYVWGFPATSDG